MCKNFAGSGLFIQTHQCFKGYVKYVHQRDQLVVGHMAQLTLKLGKAGGIHINAPDLQLSQQILLLHQHAPANFLHAGADDIPVAKLLFSDSHDDINPLSSFYSRG